MGCKVASDRRCAIGLYKSSPFSSSLPIYSMSAQLRLNHNQSTDDVLDSNDLDLPLPNNVPTSNAVPTIWGIPLKYLS